MTKAVFIDRDGTLSEEMGYIHDKDIVHYRLIDGAAQGLKKLVAAGYTLCLSTNQSGVARGYYGAETVSKVHRRLKELLAQQGAKLDGIYLCPHHPKPDEVPVGGEGISGRVKTDPNLALAIACDCRKPGPGMALQAKNELDLDLNLSWAIGDKDADLGFAKSFGGRAVLVKTGYGKETFEKLSAQGEAPLYVAQDLNAAADLIIKTDARHE